MEIQAGACSIPMAAMRSAPMVSLEQGRTPTMKKDGFDDGLAGDELQHLDESMAEVAVEAGSDGSCVALVVDHSH